MSIRALQELPRFSDRLGWLYVEHGHIEQESNSISYVTQLGRVPIPAADLAALLLGPGTTITHKAVQNLAECNCTVVWCGENGVRFYSAGRGGTYQATNLLKQAELVCDSKSRLAVVRRMYEKRFHETLDPKLSLEQIRGREGYRVRAAYQKHAEANGLEWKGRFYDPDNWNAGDDLNRALSAASSCLNGLVTAAVVSAGYSPGLGFIHTGKQLSFVYDVADLYKIDFIVPHVFGLLAQGRHDVDRRARLCCRVIFQQHKLMSRIIPDINEVLYGRADLGESPTGPEGGPEPLDDRAESRDLPRQSECPGS